MVFQHAAGAMKRDSLFAALVFEGPIGARQLITIELLYIR